MRPVVLALAFAPILLSTGAAAIAQTPPIQPGYWESRNRVTAAVTLSNKVELKCVTAKDVEKFFSGPSNRHYTCTYPSRTYENGVIHMAGTCIDKKGRKIGVEVNGTYTPTSFEMRARLNTKFAGVPISGGASSEAHRIGDTCPAGSEIN